MDSTVWTKAHRTDKSQHCARRRGMKEAPAAIDAPSRSSLPTLVSSYCCTKTIENRNVLLKQLQRIDDRFFVCCEK